MTRSFLISAPGAPLELVHAATRADAIARAAQLRELLDLEPVPDDAWNVFPIPALAGQSPLDLN